MITDFVRDRQAYFKCTECGAESMILKYEISKHYNFPVINHEKTISEIESFKTQHAICKPVHVQLEL